MSRLAWACAVVTLCFRRDVSEIRATPASPLLESTCFWSRALRHGAPRYFLEIIKVGGRTGTPACKAEESVPTTALVFLNCQRLQQIGESAFRSKLTPMQ